MSNLTPEEVERERIFSNDRDPMEELNELRLKEAEESSQEEGEAEAEAEEDPTNVEEESSESEDASVEFDKEDTTDSDDDNEEDKDGSDNASEDSAEKEGEEEDADDDDDDDDEFLHKFKANGQDFEFTQKEINEQFGAVFGKAMDYTQKMQKISPYRKMISALEDEGIDQKQLNLAIDVLKGDKGALRKLVEEKSIDIYDLDKDSDEPAYQEKDYGKDEKELNLEDVTRQLSADPEYSQTLDVVTNQWDSSSRRALADNPEWLTGLHSDVKSGVFAKVSPEAMKIKVLDGGNKPDIEYYLMAGDRLFGEKEKVTSPQIKDTADKATQKFKKDSATADKKRSASSTRSRGGRKGVVDYLEDSDEAFDEWYDNLMKSV